MKSLRRHLLLLVLGGLVGVAALACGAARPDTSRSPDVGAAARTALTPTYAPTPVIATEESEQATPGAYDPDAIMHRLYREDLLTSRDTRDALDQIIQHKDISQVPVLIEIMRFLPYEESYRDVVETLRELTGQDFGVFNLKGWTEWLGQHRDQYRPPRGYPEWKTRWLSFFIDPRYYEFLKSARETARIDLTEVMWGGVIVDGIPDLANPRTISPQEARYLGPEERVFGVSINGEHRAYPLRITNPHELVNDVLGGEPIALIW